MTIEVASLKIDFKVESNGQTRIIDLSDGFSASTSGFSEVDVVTKMLVYMHEATQAPIVPIFGELLHVSNGLQAAKIPIVLREKIQSSWLKSDDLINLDTRYIPFSEMRRIHSYVAYFWGKADKKTIVPPIGLVAMEMHKALWYFLMEQKMSADEKPNLLFWTNDEKPSLLDLSTIKSKSEYGYFIKIADRSTSHGEGVYYVKNEEMLTRKLSEIHLEYKKNKDENNKHLYVIEPAYITVKQYMSQSYNVTGRAFITLVFDTVTQKVQVKIAAAKWIYPSEPLNQSMSERQMLANNSNCICYLDLNDQELQALTSGIEKHYAKVFSSCFIHEDLLEHCKAHPYMQQFRSCLRRDTVYLGLLNLHQDGVIEEQRTAHFNSMINSLIHKHYLPEIKFFLEFRSQLGPSFLYRSLSEDTLKRLCKLSCYKHYIQEIKKLPVNYQAIFTFIPQLVVYEQRVEDLILITIMKFLQENDQESGTKQVYEKSDLDKTLREAAYWGNPSVMTALIYTHRANPHAPSPSNQTATDWANKNKNLITKTQCLQILTDINLMVAKSSPKLDFRK
jgi:hypothetical protein